MSQKYLHKFEDFPTYTDPGAINQLCRDVLDKGKGEARNLQMGTCRIDGPGQVAEDAHSTWTQYFLATEGEGTLYLNGEPHKFGKDMIVEIPKNTKHFARCEKGQSLTYFFINIHD